jgi:hypothetical protein
MIVRIAFWAQPGYCCRVLKTRRINGAVRLELCIQYEKVKHTQETSTTRTRFTAVRNDAIGQSQRFLTTRDDTCTRNFYDLCILVIPRINLDTVQLYQYRFAEPFAHSGSVCPRIRIGIYQYACKPYCLRDPAKHARDDARRTGGAARRIADGATRSVCLVMAGATAAQAGESGQLLSVSLGEELGALQRGAIVAAVGGGGKTSLCFALARDCRAVGLKALITTTTKMMVGARIDKAFVTHAVLATSMHKEISSVMSQKRS